MGYSYDHDCPFEAFITNLGKYNEGELAGEWVKFPTTAEELKRVFERIGIGSRDDFGNVYEEWFISDYDCYVDGLSKLLGEYEDLDELNYLASKIDELDEGDYERFLAAMEISDYTGDIKGIINLTDNLDKYDVYPGINDYYDLGRMYIEELDALQVPEHLMNYIDYEAYGRDIALDEVSAFSDHGYVRDTQDRFVEYYDGDRENIPEEYRVMNVDDTEPEQENTYADQEEKDSAMLDEATDIAFDMDVFFRGEVSGYAEKYPEEHEQRENLADLLIDGRYREMQDLLSPIAGRQDEAGRTAGALLERMENFDRDFIDMEGKKITASMELAHETDTFFRANDAEYFAMFPDGNIQQFALHDCFYKGDTSLIKTGLINFGRERDMREDTSGLIAKISDFEKAFGIDTYSVYQLKDGEEYRDFQFEPLDRLEAVGKQVDSGNYELVYSAPYTEKDSLEGIYAKLNMDRPDNFHGHSLSVSDVVVLHQGGQDRAHYCDSFGFQDVTDRWMREPVAENTLDAKAPDTQEAGNTLTVLVVEPQTLPYVKEIPAGLSALQEEVGGMIAATYPFQDRAALICNDESKLNGMEMNRALRDADGAIYDIMCGNFLVVGLGEEDFTSLTPEQIKTYSELYQTPETFLEADGDLIVLPTHPSEIRAHDDRISEAKSTGEPEEKLTFYVAECMEFTSLGEYHENLTLQEAVEIYKSIPAERLNGVKGIGFKLEDGSIYSGGEFPMLTGNTIDADTINEIAHYHESPLVQEAVRGLIAAMPEAELLDRCGNYLKNAELAVEDDCNMIDGIINNGSKDEPSGKQEEKPSVLGKLDEAKKECAERKPKEPEKKAEKSKGDECL